MAPSDEERHEKGLLPQFYADMHGWEAMVAAVAEFPYLLAGRNAHAAGPAGEGGFAADETLHRPCEPQIMLL